MYDFLALLSIPIIIGYIIYLTNSLIDSDKFRYDNDDYNDKGPK